MKLLHNALTLGDESLEMQQIVPRTLRFALSVLLRSAGIFVQNP